MKYYNWQKTLTYNARWNLIISARGYGKTFGMRKQCLADYKKRGYLFCEIVRTKDEIRPVADGYFSKVQKAGYYNEYIFQFDINKRTLFVAKNNEEKPNWQPIGYIVALTEEQFLKKISNSAFTDGDKVCRIIMDEAIIEKKDKYHRYQPREFEIINGIISTVTRETPTNPSKANVYFFGNAVDLNCPLFEGLKINKLPSNYGYYKYGDTLLHYVEPYAQEEFENTTLSGKALAGTSEGEKLFGNVFDGANDNRYIKQKPKQAKFYRGYQWHNKKFGLWIDYKNALVFVSEKVPKNAQLFAVTLDDDTVNYTLLKRSSKQIKQLGDFFYHKLLRYENVQLREQFADMCLALNCI